MDHNRNNLKFITVCQRPVQNTDNFSYDRAYQIYRCPSRWLKNMAHARQGQTEKSLFWTLGKQASWALNVRRYSTKWYKEGAIKLFFELNIFYYKCSAVEKVSIKRLGSPALEVLKIRWKRPWSNCSSWPGFEQSIGSNDFKTPLLNYFPMVLKWFFCVYFIKFFSFSTLKYHCM